MEFYNSEDDIQKMILEDIIDPDEREIFKRSTLTVVASGRVQIRGQDDHTKDTILRGHSPDTAESHTIPNQTSRKSKGNRFARVTPGVAAETEDDNQPPSRNSYEIHEQNIIIVTIIELSTRRLLFLIIKYGIQMI